MHKTKYKKQHAQGHLGSNLTPDRENRNFRKTVITNSKNHYANLEETCDKVTKVGVIVRYTKNVIGKKNESWVKFDPGWPFKG